MKRHPVAALILACTFLIPSLAAAAQIRAYVAEFAVSQPESAGLKTTLQTLLSSRMASEAIAPVSAASEADIIITGSFTQLGKIFSLDAAARLSSGRTLATVFEQGEGQDDLIPALGRISAKLKSEVTQRYPMATAAPAAARPQMQSQAQSLVQAQPQQVASQLGNTAWLSPRIANAQLGLAPAVTGPEGREFFVAETHALHLYRQEKGVKLLAEVQLSPRENILAVDCLGTDKNGNLRAYVSVIEGETLTSKIFSFEDKKLKPVAEQLPYMFRAIALNGGAKKIYAQQMGLHDDFFGDLYEVFETGGKIELKNPIQLPRYANVFNYNRLTGSDGKRYATALSTDGYLVIYSEACEELWRSSEKFGGSETFFQRETSASAKDVNERFRWRFIDQRITVTPNGEIVVPQNSGFFVLGNNRSYSKYAMVSFSWNGSSAEERWRTKQSQNYLADYYLDAEAHEIVLLEVVQKEGLFSKGGSAIRVIQAD